jgi:hypothetical protein
VAVPTHLRGPACRISLDDEQFGLFTVLRLTVGQLPREASAGQRALAAHEVASLPRSVPGLLGLDRLLDDRLGRGGVLLEEGGHLLANHRVDDALRLAVAELVLGLALELGLGNLEGQHRGEALAVVVAGGPGVALLERLRILGVLTEHASEGGLHPREVRTASVGVDVVDEGRDRLGVAVGPLHRQLDLVDLSGVVRTLGTSGQEEDLLVQRGLSLVHILHEGLDALGVLEDLVGALRLVDKFEAESARAHQIGGLAQTLLDDLVLVVDGREDRSVGLPLHRGPGVIRLAHDLELLALDPAGKLHGVDLPVLVDRDLQPVGEGVHTAHTHAVETTRHLVRAITELAPGVELGQDELDRRDLLLGVDVHGDAAPIVLHRDRPVGLQGDQAAGRVAGQGLIHRVVDDLPDEVVHSTHIGVPDVHGRPVTNGL